MSLTPPSASAPASWYNFNVSYHLDREGEALVAGAFQSLRHTVQTNLAVLSVVSLRLLAGGRSGQRQLSLAVVARLLPTAGTAHAREKRLRWLSGCRRPSPLRSGTSPPLPTGSEGDPEPICRPPAPKLACGLEQKARFRITSAARRQEAVGADLDLPRCGDRYRFFPAAVTSGALVTEI